MGKSLETVGEVLDWYQTHEVREFAPVALAERERIWRLFRAHMEGVPLSEAEPHHLLAFIVGQKGAASNHTRRRFRATICTPFNFCERLGLIARNPFRGVKLPAGPTGRDWTDAEYRAVLRNSAANFRRVIVFLRFGGARPGEGRLLTWPEIRHEAEAIVQQKHKTSCSTTDPRRIHFNAVLGKLILWMERHREHPAHVFANSFGEPWTIGSLCKHLRMVRRRAGLPADVKLHGCRHTFTTQGLLNGVDLKTMAELLGHKTVASTERYTHLVNKRKYLNTAANKAIGRCASYNS